MAKILLNEPLKFKRAVNPLGLTYVGVPSELVVDGSNMADISLRLHNGVELGGFKQRTASISGVVRPTITAPLTGLTGVHTTVNLTASAFVGVYESNNSIVLDTHDYTDWEIADIADFSNIIHSSLGDNVNLTSYSFDAPFGTTIYVRVRYRSTHNFTSEWSTSVMLTIEEAWHYVYAGYALSAPGAPTNSWRYPLALDGTGDILVIGDNLASVGGVIAGRVFLRQRDNAGVFVDDGYVDSPTPAPSGQFGKGVALSSDGIVLAVSETTTRKVHVYVRDNTGTYVWATSIDHTAYVANTPSYTNALALSADGSVLALGSNTSGLGALQAYIHTRGPGGAYALTQTIPTPPTHNEYFGSALALSGDGQTLAISAYYDATGVFGNGRVYLYSKDISGNFVPDVITPSVVYPNQPPYASHYFGSGVALSYDGNIMVVAASGQLNGFVAGSYGEFVGFERDPATGVFTDVVNIREGLSTVGNSLGNVALNAGGDKAVHVARGMSVKTYD